MYACLYIVNCGALVQWFNSRQQKIFSFYCTIVLIFPLFCFNYKFRNCFNSSLNPIPTWGSRFGSQLPKTVWYFLSFMAGVTKILDFLYSSTCLVPVELFLKKKSYEILKNWRKKILPFGKKIKKIQILCFFPKNYTISTWIWILHVLSFLLRYITSVLLKIFKFSFF